MCPFGKTCRSGHKTLGSLHNSEVLRELGLDGLSEKELLDAIKAGYLVRNPITEVERRLAIQVCRPYLDGECKDEQCLRLHVCEGYVTGTCANGKGCRFSHQLADGSNKVTIKRVGLNLLSHSELLVALRDHPTAREAWQSIPSDSDTTASSSVPAGEHHREAVSGMRQLDNGNLASGSISLHANGLSNHSAGQQHSSGSSVNGGATGGSGTSSSASAPNRAEVRQKVTAAASSKNAKQSAKDLNLCRNNILPSRCRESCGKLHLCRLFVAGICPLAGSCKSGHKIIGSLHNSEVLKERGLGDLNEKDLFDVIKAGYLARNPITDVERRFAIQVCRPYWDGECSDEQCPRLHICQGYLAGTCVSGKGCRFSHQLADGSNYVTIKRVGLIHLQHSKLKELLRVRPTLKEVWETIPIDGGLATSRSPIPVESRATGCSDVSHVRANKATGNVQPQDRGEVARSMSLCKQNICPFLCAGTCGQLHLCRLFVADMCPYTETCWNGHKLFASPHNSEVLRELGLDDLSEKELLDAIKEGYLARNPITDVERRLALKICHQYVDTECSDEHCPRLHICEGYVDGTCANGSGCGFSHQLTAGRNTVIIKRVGLNRLSHSELLIAVQDLPTAREAWQSLPPEPVPVPVADNPRAPGGVPTLCAVHAAGGHCQDDDCDGFHICGFFLAELCRRKDKDCPLRHDFDDPRNRRVLESYVDGASPELCQQLIAEMTRRAHITFANGAEKSVRMCIPYNSKSGCSADCGQFHVCHRFLAGTCDGEGCSLRHTFDGSHNQRVRDTLGLVRTCGADGSAAAVTERELTELLRARLGVSPGVYDAVPQRSGAAAAAAALPDVCASLCAGRCCSDASCRAVHVCPHFLAGACRRQHCPIGHRLDTEPNQRAMRRAGRKVTQDNHDDLVQELYAAAINVRRSEMYAKLRICIPHNWQEGCGTQGCPKVHICQRFVAGTCTDAACDLGHVVGTQRNRKALSSLGLQNAEVEYVLEMLRAVHGVRSACSV